MTIVSTISKKVSRWTQLHNSYRWPSEFLETNNKVGEKFHKLKLNHNMPSIVIANSLCNVQSCKVDVTNKDQACCFNGIDNPVQLCQTPVQYTITQQRFAFENDMLTRTSSWLESLWAKMEQSTCSLCTYTLHDFTTDRICTYMLQVKITHYSTTHRDAYTQYTRLWWEICRTPVCECMYYKVYVWEDASRV